MKNNDTAIFLVRNAVFMFGLVFGVQHVVAEPVTNPEKLTYNSHCRACTPKIWDEVESRLPRRADGSLMQPIDDTTVLNIYRQMWYEETNRADLCMNMWAENRVELLVKNAKTSRALIQCQKKNRKK